MTEPYDPWSPERRAVVARLPQLAFLTVLVGPVFFAGALGLDGLGLWLLVFLVWLGAAIVYQTNRRWASGVHTGPGTIWQALSGLAAAALIVAGTFLAGGWRRGPDESTVTTCSPTGPVTRWRRAS